MCGNNYYKQSYMYIYTRTHEIIAIITLHKVSSVYTRHYEFQLANPKQFFYDKVHVHRPTIDTTWKDVKHCPVQ